MVGLMPVGKEPKPDRSNTYLKPLVDELSELENVVIIKTGTKPDEIKILSVLLMLACNISDCRKVAGFAAHSSGHACNKCEGKFCLVEVKPNFSGIYTVASKWPERSKASNLGAALGWRNATTEKEREDLVKANGTRYFEPHRLGYFDVVRQSIIDPMLNLLLGTCSRFVKFWKKEEYFTKVNLEKMQVLAHSVELPAGFESMDQKIANDFINFKADNWKGWCLLYSSFVLTGILPKENMRNWMDFVNARRFILKTEIQQSEVDKAHELFMDFKRVAEVLYHINITGSEPLPLGVVPPKVLTKIVIEESYYECLLDFYDAAYPGAMSLGLLNSDLVAPPFGARWPTTSVYIEKYASIRLSGKTMNIAETRSPSGSCIRSLFVGQNHENVEAWPCIVLYFLIHSQRVSQGQELQEKDHVFAYVRF
ncbi:hypothetical protein INT47_010412 [Mucor saturninus]|uniref:Uncharacterized protein n=1 Tax=Mucor saturninus TaxID=64648 RepID=A0A8H7UPH8_9FUNG|nr:hypothetical protein INT47_010412 [Mucor saturninus]